MRTGLVVEVLRRNARHRGRACFTCKFLRMQLYGVTHSFWTDSCACGPWHSRYEHIMHGSCLYIWQISIMSWAHSVVYMASGISCAVSHIWGPCVRAAGVNLLSTNICHKHVYILPATSCVMHCLCQLWPISPRVHSLNARCHVSS